MGSKNLFTRQSEIGTISYRYRLLCIRKWMCSHIVGRFFYRSNIVQLRKYTSLNWRSQNIGKTRPYDASNASNVEHLYDGTHRVTVLHMANDQCQMFNVSIRTFY